MVMNEIMKKISKLELERKGQKTNFCSWYNGMGHKEKEMQKQFIPWDEVNMICLWQWNVQSISQVDRIIMEEIKAKKKIRGEYKKDSFKGWKSSQQ